MARKTKSIDFESSGSRERGVYVARMWSLSTHEASHLYNVTTSELAKFKQPDMVKPLPEDTLRRIAIIADINRIVYAKLPGAEARSWASLPNNGALCKGRSPLDVMLESGEPAMRDIQASVKGVQGANLNYLPLPTHNHCNGFGHS